MHDPMTQAFVIRLPRFLRRSEYGGEIATIWHVDPEKDGTDDSCGWFMRARHGDKDVLEKIVKRFEFDWDRTFMGSSALYYCGLFKTSGDPNLSVIGITLNLFQSAASIVFESDGRTNWKRARRFIQENLVDILLFAENTVDSLSDGLNRKFEKGCGKIQDERRRKERIESMAGCIYSWILRQERPWYRHPRWHIHHWRIQIPFFQHMRRFLFDSCAKCGKGFSWGYCPMSNWEGSAIWHHDCGNSRVDGSACVDSVKP